MIPYDRWAPLILAVSLLFIISRDFMRLLCFRHTKMYKEDNAGVEPCCAKAKWPIRSEDKRKLTNQVFSSPALLNIVAYIDTLANQIRRQKETNQPSLQLTELLAKHVDVGTWGKQDPLLKSGRLSSVLGPHPPRALS